MDVWLWYPGRNRPPLQLPGPQGAGKRPGLAGDSLSRAFALVGEKADATSAALRGGINAAGKPTGPEGQLKNWLSKLHQVRSELLYNVIDKAEPVFAEAVRDLRRWMRAEGRSAGVQRQDGARELVSWIEEFRRSVIWPLQEAFQDQASDDEDALPTSAAAANTRGAGAAAGTAPMGI